jgi:hypothetical protein
MKRLVIERLNRNDPNAYLSPLSSFDFKVVFGIITHKDKAHKSGNLPLFSKISLMRNMQQLDVRKVPSALVFIEDHSPKKRGHPKYPQTIVQVYALENGGTEVRAVAGQGLDPDRPIKSCPREVRESAVGTRYRLSVRKAEGGKLSSFHSWPYELVV